MNIEINYCAIWNYEPKAARVAEEIKNDFKTANIILNKSYKGDFTIKLNDKIIFSRKDLIGCDEKRFPFENEIVSIIKNEYL